MKDLVDLSQVAEKKNSNNKVLSKNELEKGFSFLKNFPKFQPSLRLFLVEN